jgi:hypothetical protein
MVAADIADDIGVDRDETGIHRSRGVLHAGQQPPGFVRVQGVVELKDGIERRRGQRGVRHRKRQCRLQRNRRDQSAVLLIDIDLESDVPAVDRER